MASTSSTSRRQSWSLNKDPNSNETQTSGGAIAVRVQGTEEEEAEEKRNKFLKTLKKKQKKELMRMEEVKAVQESEVQSILELEVLSNNLAKAKDLQMQLKSFLDHQTLSEK
jgi:uncharacterized membrane protein